MLVFSDLHLRESSENVCFRVLDKVERMAIEDDRVVVCCGDFWHIRYQLNVRLLNRVAEVLRRWAELGIQLELVPGNHDQVDVDGRNALEVFEGFNCRVWTEPGIDAGGWFGYVPYRKDLEQQHEDLAAVKDATQIGGLIFGHFGVEGAIMNNGHKAEEGQTEQGLVYTLGENRLILGHYHKRQQGNGWEYVGSPYQISYGEVGNVGGVMRVVAIKPFEREWIPIDVGAPAHHVLKWDPAQQSEPPTRPGKPGDHVRLDIEASHEMIVSGKFKGVLETAGLADVQICVVPTKVDREHKFALRGGETLIEAAGRFAGERLGGADSADEAEANPDVGSVMEALQRWANG